MNSYRVQVFGHAAHNLFHCTSTSYVGIPGTYSGVLVQDVFPAPVSGTERRYRVEVSFTTNHDEEISLRVHDPANNRSEWELVLQGGHSPNTWWRWSTQVITPSLNGPWYRQYQLEMKCSDADAYLGSLWIVVEDVTP
jgi:hypothetical protein